MSTGPRTPERRRRISEAQHRRWARARIKPELPRRAKINSLPAEPLQSDLSALLGQQISDISTLYRFVDPKGELRADGTKLLKRKGQHVSS
jgi:hypothetical protein